MKSLIGLLLVCSTINASEVLPLAAPPTDSSLVTQVTYEEIESFMRNRSLSEEVLQLSGDKGNGGDICEQKIREISEDIERWIGEEGHLSLKLEDSVTIADYEEKMTTAIRETQVTCISKPIMVENKEKMCVNFITDESIPMMICNSKQLLEKDINDQYLIVHHELAGVAGLESGSADGTSNYSLSNQITAFLEREIVTRLAVKDPQGNGPFTRLELSKAFRNISGCIETEYNQSRMRHLEAAKKIALRDEMELFEAVQIYNQISCISFDYTTLEVVESFLESDVTIRFDEFTPGMVEVFKKFKEKVKAPNELTRFIVDSYIKAIVVAGEVEEPTVTLLDIFPTYAWDTDSYSYRRDTDTDFSKSGDLRRAKSLIEFYNIIWGL
jgi:hypothetical protein